MGLFNNYVTPRGCVVLIGSVHTNAFSSEKAYNYVRFCTLDTSKRMQFYTKSISVDATIKTGRTAPMIYIETYYISMRKAICFVRGEKEI